MRAFLLSLLAVCSVSPAFAQDAIQSADGRYGIVSDESGPRVLNQQGASVPMLIPEDVRLHHLATLRGGWLATGVQQVGDKRHLYLRMLDAGGLKTLPAPSFQEAPIRHQPVVLSDGESLLGMLWLEGKSKDRLAVRASVWLGITWSRPVTIAREAPGSQRALAATVLADGSWLAAWARFDGEDDEIVYSIGIDNSWTTPSPLSANEVPDILPTVAPFEDGAMVAWNQFDGREYRVVTARLQEGRWLEPERETAGTLYPNFLEDEEGVTLLYFEARASSWHLRELDREGKVRRRGSVGAETSRRPLIFRGARDEDRPGKVSVRFAGQSRARSPRWESQP